MRALIVSLIAWQAGSPEPLPLGYEEQLIRSSSGQTTLAYRASSYADDPVRLEVLRAGASRWKRDIDWPLELATVDDRGWVAGFRWTQLSSRSGRLPGARGRGELKLFDATGAVAATRFALDDEGDSCVTIATHAVDLLFVGEHRLLLRANQLLSGTPSGREYWSLLDALDLSEREQLEPAEACRRSGTPMWMPHEWERWGEPALDVRAIPGAPLLVVRWPFPQWRAVAGGVELQEDFTVVDAQARPVLELAQPAMHQRADPDPEFNLAEPRFRAWRRDEWFRARATERFSIVRALDGAWLNYIALCSDGVWRIEFEWR